MTLSDKTLQLLSSHKLLSPKSRSTATPPLKIVRAMNRAIKTLNTTNGFRATILAAFVGFPLVAGFGDAHALSANATATATGCKVHVLLLKNGNITMQGLPIEVTQNGRPVYDTTSHSVYIPLTCGETFDIAVKNGANTLTRTVYMQGDQTAKFELAGE